MKMDRQYSNEVAQGRRSFAHFKQAEGLDLGFALATTSALPLCDPADFGGLVTRRHTIEIIPQAKVLPSKSASSGASNTSAAVTVTVNFSTAPTAPTNGMVLWLAADTGVTVDPNDGQSITNWADQSGLGNDARQPVTTNAPSLRNAQIVSGGPYLPVARFNVLDSPGNPPKYMTVARSPSLGNFTTNFTIITISTVFDWGNSYNLMSEGC